MTPMVEHAAALAAMALWTWCGYRGGIRYERRRCLVVVSDKNAGMPTDDACCKAALRDVERDIVRGEMPK